MPRKVPRHRAEKEYQEVQPESMQAHHARHAAEHPPLRRRSPRQLHPHNFRQDSTTNLATNYLLARFGTQGKSIQRRAPLSQRAAGRHHSPRGRGLGAPGCFHVPALLGRFGRRANSLAAALPHRRPGTPHVGLGLGAQLLEMSVGGRSEVVQGGPASLELCWNFGSTGVRRARASTIISDSAALSCREGGCAGLQPAVARPHR